jgi:bifunctional pyridoxal-dependent enzyme with beta-cystathionase and maltose regulon repressor activities
MFIGRSWFTNINGHCDWMNKKEVEKRVNSLKKYLNDSDNDIRYLIRKYVPKKSLQFCQQRYSQFLDCSATILHLKQEDAERERLLKLKEDLKKVKKL